MHNIAKERLSFAQTAKADVGGRPPTPHLSVFFYICGKCIRSVKTSEDKTTQEADFYFNGPHMSSCLDAASDMLHKTLVSVASGGFTCCNEAHSPQAAVIIIPTFSAY